MPHYNFIEIGTSDFATLLGCAKPSDIGLSIEPIQEYLDRLPNHPGVRKICGAVSSQTGNIIIHYIPDTVRIQYGLPDWMKGTNSVGSPHPTVTRYLTRKGLPLTLIHTRTVPMISLRDLFGTNHVESVDYLKMDTEGHDVQIMGQLLEMMEDGVRPQRIRFESNCLSDKMAVGNIILRLQEMGYSCRQTGTDTTATKLDGSADG